jgi:hypothetical protein
MSGSSEADPRVARGSVWIAGAGATLSGPARLSTPTTRFRKAAMTVGPLPVRTWEASSAKVISRTQCAGRSRSSSGRAAGRPSGRGGQMSCAKSSCHMCRLQVEDVSGADWASADSEWGRTSPALGNSGVTWHDLGGDQQTRPGPAPARPGAPAPRPRPHRPGVRRGLHGGRLGVAGQLQQPLHRAGRHVAQQLPTPGGPGDGGDAVLCGQTGHQTGQESRSAGRQDPASVTAMDLTISASFLPHDDPQTSLALWRDTLGPGSM